MVMPLVTLPEGFVPPSAAVGAPRSTDARTWLLERAESYGRDVQALREMGDLHAAVAYSTIRDELRKCAALIDGPEGAR